MLGFLRQLKPILCMGCVVALLTGCQSMRSQQVHTAQKPRSAQSRWASLGRSIVPGESDEVATNGRRSPLARLRMPFFSKKSPISTPVVKGTPTGVALVDEAPPALPPQEVAQEPAVDLDNLFLVSAQLDETSKPGDLNVDFASQKSPDQMEVTVEEETTPGPGPMIDPTTLAPIETVETVDSAGVPVVYEPLAGGVSPDQRGWRDNLIGRAGYAYFDADELNNNSSFIGIGEWTHQIAESNWFWHSGIGAMGFDSATPVSYTLGFSRLARIVGNKVVEPWIYAVAYDGYYVNDFLGTGDGLYADQMRGMLGYAICPYVDMGVWAAGGLTTGRADYATPTVAGLQSQYLTAQFGNRVAGYVGSHLGQTGIFNITSVGWQEGDGNFFVQSDGWVPLTQAINFWVQGAYSDSFGGTISFSTGLEFVIGRTCLARGMARHFCGKRVSVPGKLASDMPGAGRTFATQIDPCCQRYRGGWANDSYRSAFRLVNPNLAMQQLEIEEVRRTANGAVVIPPAGPFGEPVPVDPGGNGETPEDCPPSTNPLETVVPRQTDRPTRPSRLSELQGNTSHKI